METLTVKLTGLGPLLMHNGQLANPLSQATREIAKHSKKRNKTESDLYYLARLEWEGGLYLRDGEVVLPVECLYKSFLEGARKSKNGKQFEAGVQVIDDAPLDYAGQKILANGNGKFPDESLDKFFEEHSYVTMVGIQRRKVLRCRPRFTKWSSTVKLIYNSEIVGEDLIVQAIQDAGLLVGIGDYRPRYGRFQVEVVRD